MNLFVILEVDEDKWSLLEDPDQFLNDLIIYMNTFLNSMQQNRLSIITNKTEIFNSDNDCLTNILPILKRSASEKKQRLSVNLAYTIWKIYQLNKQTKTGAKIMIINISEMDKHDYINTMKGAFSAQRLNVRIDAISLIYKNILLRQTCQITGGMYLEEKQDVMTFLFGTLSSLKIDNATHAEYTMVCNCHKKMIRKGLICPVCLSIYCNYVPVCAGCQIKFEYNWMSEVPKCFSDLYLSDASSLEAVVWLREWSADSKYLVVYGPVGCGKSTFCRVFPPLSGYEACFLHVETVDEIEKISVSGNTSVDSKKLVFVFDNFDTIPSVHRLSRALAGAKHRMRSPIIVVLTNGFSSTAKMLSGVSKKIELKKLCLSDLIEIFHTLLEKKGVALSHKILNTLIENSSHDIRQITNILQLLSNAEEKQISALVESLGKTVPTTDNPFDLVRSVYRRSIDIDMLLGSKTKDNVAELCVYNANSYARSLSEAYEIMETSSSLDEKEKTYFSYAIKALPKTCKSVQIAVPPKIDIQRSLSLNRTTHGTAMKNYCYYVVQTAGAVLDYEIGNIYSSSSRTEKIITLAQLMEKEVEHEHLNIFFGKNAQSFFAQLKSYKEARRRNKKNFSYRYTGETTSNLCFKARLSDFFY